MFFKIWNFLCTCVYVQNDEFKQYDANKDGKLSLNEFHNMSLAKYGKPPTLRQWMQFHLVDTNNNGSITKEEIEYFEKHNRFF